MRGHGDKWTPADHVEAPYCALPLTGPQGLPHLEALLKVLVLLQEHGIVYDNLWCGYAQVQDSVIHGLGRLWEQTG